MMKQCLLLTIYVVNIWAYLPDYWRGKYSTTWNGTMSKKIPAKILARILTYQEMAIGETTNQNIDAALAAQAVQVRLPPNQKLVSNEPPPNVTGTFHKAYYEEGFLPYMEVLDEFNFDGNRTVPVHFGTSWYHLNKELSYNHSNHLLDEAVRNGNILNFTFRVDYERLSEAESEEIIKGKKWEIDEIFCYYEHGVGELFNGKCVIDYAKIIDHYLRLWKTGVLSHAYLNGDIKRVTNNLTFIKEYPCGISENIEHIQSCSNDSFPPIHYVPIEQHFLKGEHVYYQFDVTPVGIGTACDFTFGINKTKGTYDFNFTFLFEKWTTDLPDGLLSSYRDLSFIYSHFEIEIHYWIADPETPFHRQVPGNFYVLLAFLLIPGGAFGCAVLIALLVRSKKGFIIEVWEFWEKRRLLSDDYEKKQLEQAYARALANKNKRDIEMLDYIKQNNIHGIDEQFLRH